MWVRVYTDMRNDRKLRRLTPSQRWLWVCLLMIAKESPRPGWLLLSEGVPVDLEDMADEAAIDIDEVIEGIEKFQEQKMLEVRDGIYYITNWDKRQFESDNSTKRWRKWKERKQQTDNKQSTNVGQTFDQLPQIQNTDTDTETEKEKDLVSMWENKFGSLGSAQFQELTKWLDVDLALAEEALTITAANRHKLRGSPFNYFIGILRTWRDKGITNLAELAENEICAAKDKPTKDQKGVVKREYTEDDLCGYTFN